MPTTNSTTLEEKVKVLEEEYASFTRGVELADLTKDQRKDRRAVYYRLRRARKQLEDFITENRRAKWRAKKKKKKMASNHRFDDSMTTPQPQRRRPLSLLAPGTCPPKLDGVDDAFDNQLSFQGQPFFTPGAFISREQMEAERFVYTKSMDCSAQRVSTLRNEQASCDAATRRMNAFNCMYYSQPEQQRLAREEQQISNGYAPDTSRLIDGHGAETTKPPPGLVEKPRIASQPFSFVQTTLQLLAW